MIYRTLAKSDYAKISAYYIENASHFKPWQPKTELAYHSKDKWQLRIEEQLARQEKGAACYFIALDGDKVVGNCTLSQISYGAFDACYIGYGVCHSVEGRGIASELVTFALKFAFDKLKLNRVMANYMPHNNRSARLLNKLGFTREGIARNYLKINGRWEDHVLTALNRNNFRL